MITTGKIYKIINSIDNEIYVGSTFNQLRHRWQHHKQAYNRWFNGKRKTKCSIYEKFKLLGIKNFKIMLIKKYDVYRDDSKDRRHLLSKEQLWINKLKCININCAFNPIPENEIRKQYYKNNKEKIKGIRKQYYENNKEKIKERKNLYYENNKDKIKERKKQYYENNKEKIKEYYENNKEKLRKKFNCSCGGKYTRDRKSQHMKTKIHLNSIK
jgi:predicted GIY-YIG superfamily endonuclease